MLIPLAPCWLSGRLSARRAHPSSPAPLVPAVIGSRARPGAFLLAVACFLAVGGDHAVRLVLITAAPAYSCLV